MRRRLVRHPQADIDILECADRIAIDSPQASERFVDCVEDTFQLLLRAPFLGHSARFADPRIADLRVLAVRRFRRHLVIHRVTDDSIWIVRVVHGARDLPNLRIPLP